MSFHFPAHFLILAHLLILILISVCSSSCVLHLHFFLPPACMSMSQCLHESEPYSGQYTGRR
uniref:Uncharacterized protein n=1 Tax=Anguilla anguilla TaxID=7936 RepID=A0A0E9WF49_ANGAN